jgi:hypothetical protein
MRITTKFWIGIIVLIVLSPLGLMLPDHFKAGSAWGEWSVDEIQKFVGYVPQGMAKLSSLWNAPFPDYAFKGWEDKGLSYVSFATIISAAVGVIAVIFVLFLLGKMLAKKGD